MKRLTISKIATVLGAGGASFAVLRRAAAAGAFGQGIVVDGRGTRTFDQYALFSAALLLALDRAGHNGPNAINFVAQAASRYAINEAVTAVIAGHHILLHVVVRPDKTSFATFDSLPYRTPDGADGADGAVTALTIFTTNVWAGLIAAGYPQKHENNLQKH